MKTKTFQLALAGMVALGLMFSFTVLAQTPPGQEPSDEEMLWLPDAPPSPPGMGMKMKNMSKNQTGPGGMMTAPGEMGKMMRQHYFQKVCETDPKRCERIQKIKSLARSYRESEDPSQKQKIEKELKPLLDAELKAQQEDAKKRVREMEKRLAKIKQILKQREQNWALVVEHNFKKITGQMDYLDFSGPGGPGFEAPDDTLMPAPAPAPKK